MDSRKNKTIPALILFILLGFFWVNLGWSAPERLDFQSASPTPAKVTPTPTSGPTETITTTPTLRPTPTLTPLPAEYQETPDQTTGILFGAVFLVIIIVGGTFFVIRRKK